jgi:hypothetical protein
MVAILVRGEVFGRATPYGGIELALGAVVALALKGGTTEAVAVGPGVLPRRSNRASSGTRLIVIQAPRANSINYRTAKT